ncbi:uncharacterized protein LOC106465268 isoform X2 [Limulus polyphemus]|uniref:Uncharacterized protein LOC106465268 isoform X2 n=1 Tax=Limulus polyphemus TaxID=6850 RepID=A0ABM1SYY1_LIMPO|nr:uncharacterized protein LOC106465268 isoform X2 [Limulus polyphemus]
MGKVHKATSAKENRCMMQKPRKSWKTLGDKLNNCETVCEIEMYENKTEKQSIGDEKRRLNSSMEQTIMGLEPSLKPKYDCSHNLINIVYKDDKTLENNNVKGIIPEQENTGFSKENRESISLRVKDVSSKVGKCPELTTESRCVICGKPNIPGVNYGVRCCSSCRSRWYFLKTKKPRVCLNPEVCHKKISGPSKLSKCKNCQYKTFVRKGFQEIKNSIKKCSACGRQRQLCGACGMWCCIPCKNKWTNNRRRTNIRCALNILCKTSFNKIPKCLMCKKKYFLNYGFKASVGCSSPCKICNLRKSKVKLYGIKVCFQCEHQLGKLIKKSSFCQQDNNCNVNRYTRKPSCPVCLLYYFLERGLKPAKPIMKQIEQKLRLCTRSLRNNCIVLNAISVGKQNIRIKANENIFRKSSRSSSSLCKICNRKKSRNELFGTKICFHCQHQFDQLLKESSTCCQDSSCNVNNQLKKPSCPVCCLCYFLERGLVPEASISNAIKQKMRGCSRAVRKLGRDFNILDKKTQGIPEIKLKACEGISSTLTNNTPARVGEITPPLKPCTVTLECLSPKKLPTCSSSSQSDCRRMHKGSDLKKDTGYYCLYNRIPTQKQLSTLRQEKVISSSSEVSEREYDGFRNEKDNYSDADISNNNSAEVDSVKEIERADVLVRRKETPLYFRESSDITKEFSVIDGHTIQADVSLHGVNCFDKLHLIDRKLFLEFLEFKKRKHGQKIFSGYADSRSVTSIHTMQKVSTLRNEQCCSVKESENIVNVNNESDITLVSSDNSVTKKPDLQIVHILSDDAENYVNVDDSSVSSVQILHTKEVENRNIFTVKPMKTSAFSNDKVKGDECFVATTSSLSKERQGLTEQSFFFKRKKYSEEANLTGTINVFLGQEETMQNESVKYNVRRPDLEKVIGYKKETSPLKNNIVDDRSRLPNMNKSPLLCTSVKVTKKSKKKNIDGKTFSRKNSNRKIKLHNAEETCIILRKKFDFMNTKLFSKKSEVYSSEKCMKDSDISQKKKDVTFKNGINNITQNLTGTWLDANITEIVEAIVDESNVCTSLIGHCSQALEVGKNLEKSISTLNKNFPRYETEVLGSTETDPLNTQKKETPLVSKTTMTVESDGVKKTAHQALLSSLNDNCQFKEITDIRERKTRFPEKSESDFKVVETGQSKIKEFNEKQIRLITEDKIVTRLRDPTPDINIDISPGKSDSFLGDTFLTIDMVEDHDCYDRNCSSGRLADLECPSGVALNCYSELTLPEHVSSSQSLITAQKESIIKYSENIPKRSTVENPHYNSELSRNVKMKKTTVNVGTPEGFPMGSSSVRKNLQTISQSSIFSSKDIAQSLRTYSKNYQIKIKEKEKMGCMDDNPVVSSIGRGNHLNPVRKGQLNTEDSNMIEVTEDNPNDSTSVTNAGLVSNKFVLSQPKRFSEKNKSLQNLNTVTKIPDYKIPNNNRMLHNKKLIKCNIALSEKKIADCEEKPVKPETSKNEELITTTDVELENQKYSVSAKAVALSCSNPQVDFFLSCDSENKEDEGCLYLDSSKSQQHQQYSPKSVSERRQTAVNYTLLPFSSVTKEQRNTTNLDICQITLVSENLLKAAINSESVENLQKHSHYDNQGTCVNDKWNLSSITHEGLCSEVHCIHMTTNKDNLIKTFEENLSSIENNMQNRFQNGTEVSSNVEQEPNDLNSESEFLVNMSCKSAHKLFFTDDENENCDNDDSQQTANSLRKSSPTVTQNKFKQQASSNLEYSEKISKKKDLYKTPESVQELHTTNAMPEPELKNIYENQYGVGTPVNFGMFKSVNLSPVVKIKRLPFSVIKSIVVKSADSTQKKTSLSISSSSPTSGSLKSVDSETESCCFSKKESKRDSHFSESCKSTDDKANVPGSYLSEISQTRRTCDHLLSSSVFKERQSNFSVLKQKLSFAEGMISEDVKKCTSYSKKSELDIPNVKSLDMYNIQATIRSSGNNHSTEVSPPRPPLNNVGSFYLDELDTEILDYEPEPQDVSLEVASIRTLEFEEDLMISGLGSHRNEKRENFKIDDLTNSEASEVECLETDKSTTKDIERYMKTNLDTGTEAQASSESIAVADEENTDSESGIFQWIKKNQQRNNHKTILNTRHPNEFAQKVDTQMLLTENHSMNLPTDDVGVDEEDTLSLCPCSPSILMEDLSNNEEEPHDSGVAEKSRLKFPSDEPLSSNKFPCADPRLTSSERLKMKIQQSERIANQESNSSKGIIKKIGNKNILTDFGKKNLKVTESQDKSQGCKIISSEKGRGRNNSIRSIAFTPKGYCRSFWLHGQCNRNWCKFVHMLGSGKVNSECFGENVKGSLLSQDLAHESEAIILQHIKKSCEQGTLNKAFQDFQKVYLRQQVHFIKQLLRILASSSVKLKQSGRVKFVVQYIRKLFLVDGSFCSEIISLCEECMEHTRDALWDIFQLCSENKISLHPKAIQILMHAFMTHMRDWSKIFPVMMYGVSYCHIQIPSDILDLGLQELHHNPYLCNLPLILVDKLPPSDFTHLSSDGIRNFISVLNKVGRYADAKKIHYKLEMLSNQQRSKFLSSQNNSFETNLLTRIHKFVDEDSWGQVQTIFSEDGLERKDGNVIFTIYNAISQHTDKAGEKFSCFVRTVTLNGSHLPDKPHQYLLAQMGCALLLESHQNNHLNVTFEVLETMLDYKIDFYQLLQHDTVPIANTIGIPPLVIKSPSHVALVAVEICLTLEKLREAQKILTMTDWVITTNQNLELQAQEQLWRAQLLKKLSTQLLKIEQLRNGALVLKKLLETLKNDFSWKC